MNRQLTMVGLCLATFVSSPAQAEPSLCSTAASWLDRCMAGARELTGQVRHCSTEGLVFELTSSQSPKMAFEITPPGRPAFRTAFGLGVSPVAQLDSWSQAPAPLKNSLERLLSCASSDDRLSEALMAGPRNITDTVRRTYSEISPTNPPQAIGWLWIVGLTAVVIVMVRRFCALDGDHRHRWLLLAATGTVVIALLRWCVLPVAFFHQNGHGPAWVSSSLGGNAPYGPGFRELFGWIHHLFPGAPDHQIFVCQAVAVSLIPALVFLLAVATGASTRLAIALALLAAIDPVVGRVGQSESYFATGIFLLTLATTTLAIGGCATKLPRYQFWLALLAAATLIAQASRVHPTAWVPSALVPTVLLFGPATMNQRLRRWLVATVVIGGYTTLVSGMTIWMVTEQKLAAHINFAPATSLWVNAAFGSALVLLLLVVVRLGLGRLPCNRWIFATLVGALVVLAIFAHPGFWGTRPIILAAYYRLVLPLIIAPLVALATGSDRTVAWRGVAVTAAAAALLLWHSPAVTPLPTDILEEQWITEIRERIPNRAVVEYLGRVDKNYQSLPLFGYWSSGPIGRLRESTSSNIKLLLPDYYVHSSLCSFKGGQAFCDGLEASYQLRSIVRTQVPALQSIPYALPYLDRTVELELFKVEGWR